MPNDMRNVTGGQFDAENPGFTVASIQPTVTFDFETADPPSYAYVGVNDKLLIHQLSNFNGGIITVNVELLRPDGQIIPITLTVLTAVGRSEGRTVFQLAEGFILSVTVNLNVQTGSQNPVFVAVSLVRQPFNDQSNFRVLCAGYCNAFLSFGYPEFTPQRTTDGAGIISSYNQGAPAAGADWVFTVPVLARFRLMSLTSTLTTAVAAANRDVTLVIDDGANIIAQIPAGFALAASLSNTYTFGDSLVQSPAFNGFSIAPTPSNLLLRPGWRVRSVTGNIQAADQWSATQLGIVEWIENV